MRGGRSVPIIPANRVIVGPRDDAKERFKSSKETKAALLEAVNPVNVKMKVNKFTLGPNNTVAIEGEHLDAETLQ